MCVNQPVMCFQQLTASWTIYYHHGKIHYSIRQLCAQPELRRATSPAWQQPSRDPNAAGLSIPAFNSPGQGRLHHIHQKQPSVSYSSLPVLEDHRFDSSERCCKSQQQVGTLQITTDEMPMSTHSSNSCVESLSISPHHPRMLKPCFTQTNPSLCGSLQSLGYFKGTVMGVGYLCGENFCNDKSSLGQDNRHSQQGNQTEMVKQEQQS